VCSSSTNRCSDRTYRHQEHSDVQTPLCSKESTKASALSVAELLQGVGQVGVCLCEVGVDQDAPAAGLQRDVLVC
jgi:hypothetical protein